MTRGISMMFVLGITSGSVAHAADAVSNIVPWQAVISASEHPDGVDGTFEMVVLSIDHQAGYFFLNSEGDHRSPRNLRIVLSEAVAAAFEQKIGVSSEDALLGRSVLVRGTALRTKITLIVEGAPHGFYYQTRIMVAKPDQIEITGK